MLGINSGSERDKFRVQNSVRDKFRIRTVLGINSGARRNLKYSLIPSVI